MEGTDPSNSIFNSFASLSISDTNIDFGPDFAKGKSYTEYAAIVNQYLQLHEGNKISRFHIVFSPLDMFAPDIDNWITFAASKQVEDLILDFSTGYDYSSGEFDNGAKPSKLPGSFFNCKALTSVSLGHCDFNPPQGFTGFDYLKSLSLSYVNISKDVLEWIISSVPSLETMVIKACSNFEILKVSSQMLKKLVLAVPCGDLYDIEINAPQLQSFIYYGQHIFGDTVMCPKNPFTDISSLTDAFISSIGLEFTEPEHDYIELLSKLKQIKVLTICVATLMNVTIYGEEYGHESLPVMLENLKELQLLMSYMNEEYLSYIYGFFRHCPSPFLEKLFIYLPMISEDQIPLYSTQKKVGEPSDVTFKHLKAIKIANFKGCASELRLVKFLLERALVLEILFIVVPPEDTEDGTKLKIDQKNLYEQMSVLPKTSPGAKIVLFDSLKDDNFLTPTHTEYFSELSGFPYS